jgi:uncharacterized membrane protein
MHGPYWLENWIVPAVFLAAGSFFLYLAIKTQKVHRRGQHNEMHSGIEIDFFNKRIIDTNKGWVFFTLFLGGMALGSHVIFEYILHMYDTTPIDSFTHGLSAMGITSIVLNFYLTKKRQLYYPISIFAAWVGFILWEIYEWIQVSLTGASGFIQTEPIDMAVDLWVDTLGALSVCFIYDEFTD